MNAASLFAGIGGFELALERAGIPTTVSVEIDRDARGVIAHHYPHTTLLPDVREVTGDQLTAAGFNPPDGILTAGFPCQDVSVAGQRAGLAGDRSGLYWHIDRLLEELHPQWVLLENVPGLLSSNGGRDMGAVLGSLADRGYGYAYRVLDASGFGLPQRRHRVFIVGCLGDRGASARVLLEPERRGLHLAPGSGEGQDTPPEADPTIGGGSRIVAAGTLVTALTASFGAGGPDPAHAQAGWIVPSPYGPRRMTPVEWERIQGFPDGWTTVSGRKRQGASARYKQLGNAVAVPVVEWIARRIAGVVEVRERDAA